MKLWKRAFCLVLIVLALSTSVASVALAAPQEQASGSTFTLGTSFSFDLYHKGSKLGTLTVNSDATWATTDPAGAPISSGTLTMQESSHTHYDKVVMEVTQVAPAAGDAELTLFIFGKPGAALVVGDLFDKGTSHYTGVTGMITAKASVLRLSDVAPVMLTGAPTS